MAQLAIAAAGAALGAATLGTAPVFLGGLSGTGIGWIAGSVLGSLVAQPKMKSPALDDLSVAAGTCSMPADLRRPEVEGCEP